MIEVRVTGVDKIARKLTRKYPEDIKKLLRRAMSPVYTEVKNVKLTGEYLKVQTGRLRSSIRTEVFDTPDVIRGVIGTDVWYGKLWETGEATDERGRMVTLGNRKPRPFLKDSLEEHKQEVMNRIKSGLLELAQKYWG